MVKRLASGAVTGAQLAGPAGAMAGIFGAAVGEVYRAGKAAGAKQAN
jgi:hypothetical protein